MINQFHNMDNMEGLAKLDDNSIDCLVTDPPYGYNFMGKGWDKVLPPIDTWKECLRVLKPGSFVFIMSAPRQDVLSRMMINLEDAGFNIGFTSIYWTYATGFPKASNMGKMVDKRLGTKRETIKQKFSPNQLMTKDGNKRPWQEKAKEVGYHELPNDIPVSLEAYALNGSYAGLGLKPAVEVIICCMKPLSEKSYVDQALSNGKGVTWLDDCRVPYQSDDDLNGATFGNNSCHTQGNNIAYGNYSMYETEKNIKPNSDGRFPANLLVSDDVLDDEFSRFFDLDAWEQKTYPFAIIPKPSKVEKNLGVEDSNNHCTVKPLKLMSYLITLGSRPGDIILDPYSGSGTTGIAAFNLDRKFIAFELEKEYNDIAEARFEGNTGIVLEPGVVAEKKKTGFDLW